MDCPVIEPQPILRPKPADTPGSGKDRVPWDYWLGLASVCVFLSFGGWLYLHFAGILQELPFAATLTVISSLNASAYGLVVLARGRRMSSLEILGTALIGILLASHAYWYDQFAGVGESDLFIRNSALTLIYPILLWTGGTSIGISLSHLDRGKLTLGILSTTTLFLAGIVVLGARRNFITEGSLGVSIAADTEVQTAFNYLVLGDSLAVVGLMLVSRLRRIAPVAIGVYISLAVLLLQTRSRTSLTLFLVAGACLFIAREKLTARLVSALLVLLPLAVIVTNIDIGAFTEVLDRLKVLLEERWADDSFAARIELMKDGLQDLRDYWVFGRYMSEWWRTGQTGSYIHNILSYWASYGVIVISLLVLQLGKSLRCAILALRSGNTSGYLVLALLVYGVGAVILARSYNWPLLWLPLGLAAGLASATPPPPPRGTAEAATRPGTG